MALRLRSEVTATDTEDGLVLLDERSGRYFQLNQSGTTVLRLLLGGHTHAEVARELAHGTAVTPERCLRDVESLVHTLCTRRLVVTR
jgi:hypothetical protein